MHEFDAWRFNVAVHELTKFLWIGIHRKEDEEVGKELQLELRGLAEDLEYLTKKLQLKAAHTRTTRGLRRALVMHGTPKWGAVRTELRVLWEVMEPEVRERWFTSIDATKGEYLSSLLGDPPGVLARDRRKGDPIWAYIWKQFPDSQLDCEEAIYCYALERHTACIFHSMRVAEIGLRGLARRMKVKLPKGKKLEWAEWQLILREMSKKTEFIGQTTSAGPRKDELLEFYSGAIGQFNGFKDEFRNQVMHVRKTYDEFDSERALVRVRDFMEKLAGKIDQKGRRVK